MSSVFTSVRFASLIVVIAILLVFTVDSNYSAPVDTTANTRGVSDLTKRVTTYKGFVTWYNTGLGACGIWNNDGQMVAAIGWKVFDKYTPNGNPNKNKLCGKTAKVTFRGKTISVKIVDRCAGCPGNDIDLSRKYYYY